MGEGGELRVETRTAHQVQREFGLGEKLVPQVEWKVLVDAAQAGDEMIFERADGTFRSVASMKAGRDKLEINVGCAEKAFQSSGAFVVQAMELGAQAGVGQTCVYNLEGGKNARTRATMHRLDKYAVAVVVVNDQHVIISGARRKDKLAGLVRMDLPCGRFENGGETVMRTCMSVVVWEGKRIRRGDGGGRIDAGCGHRERRRFRGALIFS